MNLRDNHHILWLTSSYPRSKNDSASIFLRYLSSSIANKQIQIDLLFPDNKAVDPHYTEDNKSRFCFHYFLPRSLQKLAYGSGILPNLKQNKWLLLQVPFFILSLFITACYLTATRKPNLIHAHWIFPIGFIAVIVGKVFRIPVIITAHGGDAFALQGSFLSKIKRWTINNCDKWTSNTKATSKAIGENLLASEIIPMGIDHLKFRSGKPFKRKNDTFVLLFVGRLVEKKGVNYLIKAFSLLPDDLKNKTKLWIIGDGTERQSLEALVASLNLSKSIIFLGRLPNSELPDYYATADIFIAPSIVDSSGDTEGQGVILLEAMASGVAVISTKTGGISEVIIDSKTGLLVEPKCPEELNTAIQNLLTDNKLRHNIAKTAQNSAEKYDWNRIGQQFLDLYTRVLLDNPN